MGGSGCDQPTVLVVDDEPDLRAIIRRMLHGRGFTVLTAGSCAAALREATAHRGQIDLLVTDIRMPDGDGKVLATAFRGIRPGIPVLYISGLLAPPGSAESQSHPTSAVPGRNWLLSKPFTPAEFLAAVDRSLTV